MKWLPTEAKPGDMIRVKLGALDHYGVFVSEDEVIAFGMPPLPRYAAHPERFTVCALDVDAFACGQIVEVAVLDRREQKTRVPPAESVSRARARLGEGGYNILHNNCEHFATECVLGERRCTQADDMRRRWAVRPVCDVYLAPVPPFDERITLLPPARDAAVRQVTNPALRAARQADWRLLRLAADRSLGLDTDALAFTLTRHGQWRCDAFGFSLSHADGLVAVAVSRAAVGVDIEQTDRLSARFDDERRRTLLLHHARQEERARLSAAPQDFLWWWTRKEAVYKQSGHGVFRPKAIAIDRADTRTLQTAAVEQAILSVCGEQIDKLRVLTYDWTDVRAVDWTLVDPQGEVGV